MSKITWRQRKELREILENKGIQLKDLINGEKDFPIEYVEKILKYHYELTEEQINDLTISDQIQKVSDAFIEIEFKIEQQKKS